jgi:Domain of Unknown Function (DUF1080).
MRIYHLLLTVFFCAAFLPSCKESHCLFNGSDLDNWGFVLKDSTKSADQVFYIKDGNIHIAGEPFGYMYTKEIYDNFKLQLEWRWPEEASNSGIFLFVQNENQVWPNAIECQLKAGNAGDIVLLNGSDLSEYIVPEGEERPNFPIIKKQSESSELPVREWNKAEITCENGNITIYINGVLQNQGTKSLHKSGHIALQSEGKDIQFRNLEVTKL